MPEMTISQFVVGQVQTNCYVAANKDTGEALVIDPGASGEALCERMKKDGLKPVAILVTHAHFDHIMGAKAIKETFNIPIYLHEKDKDSLSDGRINASWMIGRQDVYEADEFLKDEQELDLAGFHLRVLFTPGHTPGGCCYYFPYQNVLFSGDTLFCESVGRTDFEGGSTGTLIRSIKDKLMVLPENTMVYPGHGEATTIENERMYNPYL